LRKAVNVIQRQEGINQNRADRVALYAAAASGFSPRAYMELFDRLAETNGHRRSVLNVFFGATTLDLSRLREIKKALKQLPQPCQKIVPAASAEFRTWQAAVMSDNDLARR
jgi:predicted Zn-dependent protease